jgi:hypothetical protein
MLPSRWVTLIAQPLAFAGKGGDIGLNPATAQKFLMYKGHCRLEGSDQAMARRELMIKIVQLMGK